LIGPSEPTFRNEVGYRSMIGERPALTLRHVSSRPRIILSNSYLDQAMVGAEALAFR